MTSPGSNRRLVLCATAPSTYYCHTPKDTCIDDRDCTGDNYCDYDPVEDRWKCTAPDMNCAIG